MLSGGLMALLAAIVVWLLRRRAEPSDSNDLGTVSVWCLWCMNETCNVTRAELFRPRDPQPCRNCGKHVAYISQGDGGRWFIS
jgi:hypothetical protein